MSDESDEPDCPLGRTTAPELTVPQAVPAPDSPADPTPAEAVPALAPAPAAAEDDDHHLAEAVADLIATGQRVEAGRRLREARPSLRGQRWAALKDALGLSNAEATELMQTTQNPVPAPSTWLDFAHLAPALGLTMAGCARQLRAFNLQDECGPTDRALQGGMVRIVEVAGWFRILWHLPAVHEAMQANLPPRRDQP